MPTWAESGEVKIKRAKEHIRDLESKITAYRDRRGYSIVPQKKDDGGTGARVVYSEHPPVLEWGAIAGDAVHNLHSALDTLVWISICAVMQPATPGKWAKYPFSKFAKDFEATGIREIEGRSPAVGALIRATKPYADGNQELYGLHAFDNQDKHRVLIPAFILPKRVELKGPSGNVTIALSGDPLNDGTEILVLPAKQPGDKAHFTTYVAFTEPKVFHRKSVLPTLRQLTKLVQGICDSFIAAGVVP